MLVNENDLTLLTPVFNTSPKHFLSHYSSVSKFSNMKKIYTDDAITCPKTRDILYNKIARLPNVTILKNQSNRGQEYSVHRMAYEANIQTKYIIRVDADDELLSMPGFNTKDKDFDALLLQKTAHSFSELINRGGSPNGSVFKTEVFKEIIADHDKIKEYNMWMHEDIWYALNFFKSEFQGKKKYKITKNISSRAVTKRNHHSLQQTYGKVISRKKKRYDTFLIWSMFHNDVDFYKDVMISLYGYDEAISKRRKRIHDADMESNRLSNS